MKLVQLEDGTWIPDFLKSLIVERIMAIDVGSVTTERTDWEYGSHFDPAIHFSDNDYYNYGEYVKFWDWIIRCRVKGWLVEDVNVSDFITNEGFTQTGGVSDPQTKVENGMATMSVCLTFERARKPTQLEQASSFGPLTIREQVVLQLDAPTHFETIKEWMKSQE